MGAVIKWVFGIIVLILFFYGIIIAINEIKIRKARPKTFPCTYISGKCTVKPTWKNCQNMGGVPENVCERRLNKK